VVNLSSLDTNSPSSSSKARSRRRLSRNGIAKPAMRSCPSAQRSPARRNRPPKKSGGV